MSEKGFYFPASWATIIRKLSKNERLTFYEGILDFCIDGKEPNFENEKLSFAFEFIKSETALLESKSRQISKARAEAGAKGGAPKGNQNAKKEYLSNGEEMPF